MVQKEIIHKLDKALFEAFKPPELITPSEWAQRYRIIPPRKSVSPGPWKNEKTPYLVKIMDSFADPNITEIVLCAATQVGKTQAILNCLGYLIDQDPDPVLIVYPTEDTGRDIFRDYLDPMITSSPKLLEKKSANSDDYTLTRMVLSGATIYLGWANSPSSLSSKPIRYLFLDEVDKYPTNIGKEASPIELAIERTSTYWNRKIFLVSTPTLESGPIWRRLQHAEVIYYYYVPCPHCKKQQRLVFEQIKWSNEIGTYSEAERTAYYECAFCKKAIKDVHKEWMLSHGIWKPLQPVKVASTIGFHLPGIYSPWRSFGQLARKFLESKKYPERLQNFINSWLAEPWKEDLAVVGQEEAISNLKVYCVGQMGTVPEWATTLTGGVDVQEDRLYYVIRAWGPDMTSYLVLEGQCATFEELEKIMFRNSYPQIGGANLPVELCCIDSGFRTREVYRFVERNYPRARSVKGASTDLAGRPYALPSNESRKQIGIAAPYLINTNQFKDFLFMRRRIPPGEPGAFYLYQGVSEDYLKQITSEIRTIKGGKVHWVLRSEYIKNHLWDAEVYALSAAEMLQVAYRNRRVVAEKEKPPSAGKGNELEKQIRKGRPKWLPQTKGWLTT